MAVIKKDGGYMPLPISIKRGNPIPLDATSIWYDYDSMAHYAATDVTAYVGQILVHVDEAAEVAKVYVIASPAGDLTLVGEDASSGSGSAINVDNHTIELDSENLLRLKDFGVRYYRYVAASEDEEGNPIPASYVLQEVDEDHPWKAGLIPQVAASDDGNYIIGWYEPNPTTIDGVNTAVTALQGELQTVKNNLSQNYYTKEELAKVLNYKGAKNSLAEIEAITDGNIGDVYVDKSSGIEYIWDGTQWDALGNTVDLSGYVTKAEIGTLETDVETLQTDVGTLKTDTSSLKKVQDQLVTDVDNLETQVGNLETLIGAPANAENNTEASGLYAVIAKEIGDANFLKGVQVDGTDLAVSQRKVQLSTFNKDSTVSGLVPVAAIELGENEKKSDYFLNAEGNWAIPLDSRIGTLTYNNVAYDDVTSYVDARVQNATIQWESISQTV